MPGFGMSAFSWRAVQEKADTIKKFPQAPEWQRIVSTHYFLWTKPVFKLKIASKKWDKSEEEKNYFLPLNFSWSPKSHLLDSHTTLLCHMVWKPVPVISFINFGQNQKLFLVGLKLNEDSYSGWLKLQFLFTLKRLQISFGKIVLQKIVDLKTGVKAFFSGFLWENNTLLFNISPLSGM